MSIVSDQNDVSMVHLGKISHFVRDDSLPYVDVNPSECEECFLGTIKK
jgi:hypothetical protein